MLFLLCGSVLFIKVLLWHIALHYIISDSMYFIFFLFLYSCLLALYLFFPLFSSKQSTMTDLSLLAFN